MVKQENFTKKLKFDLRFKARKIIRGKGQIILASVMEGMGNGYKDDFFKMAFGKNSKGKIGPTGRYYGSYFLSTKGKIFEEFMVTMKINS